jgi:hypothetical protein
MDTPDPRDPLVISAAQAILVAVDNEVQARKRGGVPASCVSSDLYTAAVQLAQVLDNAGHAVPTRQR